VASRLRYLHSKQPLRAASQWRKFQFTAPTETSVDNVDPSAIQILLDDVERLKAMITAINGANALEGNELDPVRAAGLAGGEKLDSAEWSRLSVQRQHELQEQLILTREALLTMARRASRDSAAEAMEGAVSGRSVIWLAIFGFIFAATLLSLIR